MGLDLSGNCSSRTPLQFVRCEHGFILVHCSKTAVLMYKATHGTAPSYLSQLVRVADLPGRRSLRSARTNRLLVPPVQLSTVGGRAFPVAGPTI